MGCEGCSQGCLNGNTKEGALLEKIEALIKKGNPTNNKMYYPGLEITITGLLSVNPEFCPTYVTTIIRRILKAKTGDKPDQLIDVFKKVIVKEFNAMDDNASTLGWSGAQEILKDLKENVPELEEPLRKYLHKMIGCE